jgi:hypothetical protein
LNSSLGAVQGTVIFRYLIGTVGDLDRDKNARPGVIKLIKNNACRAFLAPFKRR